MKFKYKQSMQRFGEYFELKISCDAFIEQIINQFKPEHFGSHLKLVLNKCFA